MLFIVHGGVHQILTAHRPHRGPGLRLRTHGQGNALASRKNTPRREQDPAVRVVAVNCRTPCAAFFGHPSLSATAHTESGRWVVIDKANRQHGILRSSGRWQCFLVELRPNAQRLVRSAVPGIGGAKAAFTITVSGQNGIRVLVNRRSLARRAASCRGSEGGLRAVVVVGGGGLPIANGFSVPVDAVFGTRRIGGIPRDPDMVNISPVRAETPVGEAAATA